jgi:hypothetical protein
MGLPDAYCRGGAYVTHLLKGANPADLPKALGLAIRNRFRFSRAT